MSQSSQLSQLLGPLAPEHREALQWFISNAGRITGWPGRAENGIFLATKGRGIHKPEGWEHALSVRQTLDPVYPDREPRYFPNGSWRYLYHQQGRDLAHPERRFDNRALLKCRADNVPVGVFRQISKNPGQYEVLGVALVTELEDGYFTLEGFSSGRFSSWQLVQLEISDPRNAIVAEGYDPALVEDTREKVKADIVRRRGQAGFRSSLLSAYSSKCAISACNAVQALEAAHIAGYKGEPANALSNGLLLRADLHTLFDLGLIAVHERDREVILGQELANTTYEKYHGRPLRLPATASAAPSEQSLRWHRRWAGL